MAPTLARGDVNFREATFGEGWVSFHGATSRGMCFSVPNLAMGMWTSRAPTFGEGCVHFRQATFGEGDVNFREATFGGVIYFTQASLGEGNYNFDSAQFAEQVHFDELGNTEEATAFSFRYARFSKSLNLSSKTHFACVPDLRNTHMGHHVSLRGLQLQPKLKTEPRGY